jgi:hypothetical protein
VACCRWCGIGLGWSGALAGPPRDQLTGDEPMDQDYPDPPPELVQQWWEEADQHVDCDDPETYFDYVAIQAAQWGAALPMTDYKALCARMADELDHYRQLLMDDRRETHALATEARAALAQPEPEGPSKAELRQIFDDQSGFINDEQVMWWSDFQPAARAVLARWGNL